MPITARSGPVSVAQDLSTDHNMRSSLPVECVSSILSFLPLKDLLLHASHICKPWRKALKHPTSWSNIQFNNMKLVASFNHLKRSYPLIFGKRSCVSSLELKRNLHSSDFSGTSCDLPANLVDKLCSMDTVQRVELTHLHALTGGFRFCWPNLTRLSLIDNFTIPPYGMPPRLLDFSACPNLQWLVVDSESVYMSVVMPGLKCLQHLKIHASNLTEIEGLLDLPSLTYLRLHCGLNEETRISAADFRQQSVAVGKYGALSCAFMPELRKLDVAHASMNIARVFLRNAPRMPNVEEFCMPYDVHMPEFGVVSTWHNLRALKVEEQDELSEEEMRAIGSIRTLRKLCFSDFMDGDTRLFPLHVICHIPTCAIETLIFESCEIGPSALSSLHLLPSLTELRLIDCDNIPCLPSSMSLCRKLTTFTIIDIYNRDRDYKYPYNGALSLSLKNARVIASIPLLQNAILLRPSSQQCVRTIAQSPSLKSVFFDDSHRFPNEWLNNLSAELLDSHMKMQERHRSGELRMDHQCFEI